MEVRSRASELRERGSGHLSKEELEVDVETAGIILLLKVIGILAAGTFIIAAAFFEWQSVAIAATALFLLAVLINIPYLPLFFAEAQRDELDHLRSEK
jgi:fatty acid desaturase